MHRYDTSSRCLRQPAVTCTVEAGAEQTLPKVPGSTPIGTGNIENAVPTWDWAPG